MLKIDGRQDRKIDQVRYCRAKTVFHISLPITRFSRHCNAVSTILSFKNLTYARKTTFSFKYLRDSSIGSKEKFGYVLFSSGN